MASRSSLRLRVLERVEPALRHGERVVGEVDLLLLLVPLEHGEVDDPAELEAVLVDQFQLVPDAGARLAGEPVELRRRAGDEEHRVASRVQLRRSSQRVRPSSWRSDLPPRDSSVGLCSVGALGGLVHRWPQTAARSRPRARRCSRGPAGPRPAPTSSCGRRRRGCRRPARGSPTPAPWVLLDHAGEDLEARAAEVLGHVLHLDRVAQVRLVGAVLGDGVVVGDARERRVDRLAACRTPRTARASPARSPRTRRPARRSSSRRRAGRTRRASGRRARPRRGSRARSGSSGRSPRS